MTEYLFADLIADGLPTVRLWGKEPDQPGAATGYWISGDKGGTETGVKDWLSQPASKVSMTERQTGDGAHYVRDDQILYSAKTVTLGFTIDGETREEIQSLYDQIALFAHRQVVLRVVDGEHDTYVQGYTQAAVDPKWYDNDLVGSLTVVCPDPCRYGAYEHRIQLSPATAGGGGGLVYRAGKALSYPLTYGESVAQGGTWYGNLVNLGSATAYPVITAHGPFPYGFRLDTRFGVLSYSAPVFSPEVPVVLDCRARTAMQGGANVTRRVSSRGWPKVEPGGSLGISLQTLDGTGWVDVVVRDTYL